MNKPEDYLTRLYGNYMGYPKKMRLGHFIFREHSEEDLKVIEEMISEKGLK